MDDHPPRILMTKIGLDGHDRGSRIVGAALRDAGMEVIYTGPWQEIPDVVKIANEEDVDVIGVSSLASDHLLIPKLMDALREAELGHVGVVLGGTIPESDEKWLREAKVDQIFHPGTPLPEIVKSVGQLALEVRARDTLA